MKKIIVDKEKRQIIDSIWEMDGGTYTIHFTGYEDTIWCASISDVYMAIEQFSKYGKVNTDDASNVIPWQEKES